MKRKLLILLALLAGAASSTFAAIPGTPMYFEARDGDTTFFDSIDPIWVFPRGKKMKSGDWRRYHKMVYNFNKVYPYAVVGRKLMSQVDSTISADVVRKSQRNRYINDVERELLKLFEKDIRSMTVSQGVMLLRLIDRECGMSAYNIIKTYESGFAAAFWQLVAKLFAQNLKSRYDPAGQDARLEELVKIWDSGNWDSFYFSVFFERPKKTVIKYDSLKSEVKRKNR